MGKLKRETKETRISVDLRPGDGDGDTSVDVGDRFLGHMVVTLGRYAGLDIQLSATGDLIVFTDADMATPPDQLPKLVAALRDADVALGSRIQPDGSDMRASQPPYRRLLGRVFHTLASIWVGSSDHSRNWARSGVPSPWSQKSSVLGGRPCRARV